MNLREPKKKKRVHLQSRPSLPIDTNGSSEWRIYTAHLSASGTCIVDPVDMEAIYSMGFFGKGSLSRSFPSFGRRRFGIPPIARNRQWVRRQKWLEELQNLNENNDLETSEDREKVATSTSNTNLSSEEDANEARDDKSQTFASEAASEPEEPMPCEIDKNSESIPEEPCNKKQKVDDPMILEEAPKIKETESEGNISKIDDNEKDGSSMIADDSVKIDESQTDTTSVSGNESVIIDENQRKSSSATRDEAAKINEVILDSTEDEQICEIVEKGSNDEDVYFLNEEGKSDDYVKYPDSSESLMEEETDPYEVLVLPDTDSDTENYLTNVKSRIEKEGFPINETLHLTFEETFFLMYGLGCLQLIHYDGSVFSISNAWNHFQLQDKNFIQKYVVYHYFRSKGWIVKPGLKFGGDFLLYKQGPPFYHASYIVIVEVVDAATLLRDDVKSMKRVTWKNLIGLERLSETIAKEILFAQILWPSSIPRNGNQMLVDALSEFTVRELLWRRWDPKKKQEVVSTDDEDSDSM